MSNRQAPPTDIGKFYKQIEDFKTKIVGILQKLGKTQELIDIEKYYDKLLLLKKANVRKAIELLYQYGVTVYATQILLRDEQFFIGQVKTISENGKINDEYELNQNDVLFINQIQPVWEHLSDPVKTNIWNYVQVICLLAEKIVKGNLLANETLRLKQTGQLK